MADSSSFSKLFEKKKALKRDCARSLELPMTSKLPLVGFVVEGERDAMLLSSLLEGIRTLGVPLVVFVRDYDVGNLPVVLMEGITVVGQSDPHYTSMWRACDAAFCLSNESVRAAFDDAIVPLALSSLHGVKNYDPNHETGNSFLFDAAGSDAATSWTMFAALVRACETYKFPFDWKHIAHP